MVSKEGGGPFCSLDCDPSSMGLSLKVSVQGTNEPLGRERSNPCCPGVMAVPGSSPFIFFFLVQQSTTVSLAGLPVLRTLYKPMSMHNSANSRNCEFCVL